jgi:hypothetical protein
VTAGAWPDPPFSRREGDQLIHRIDQIDRDGTRGMQLLANQTQENSKAIGRLQAEIASRFAEHTRQHELELAAIVTRRRWRIMAVIAAAAVVVALFAFLADIAAQVGH